MNPHPSTPPSGNFRNARVQRNRAKPFPTYKFTGQGKRYGITIAEMQARRLETRNRRRALNGHAPLKSYADL